MNTSRHPRSLSPTAQPWLHKLIEAHGTKKPWGYAIYYLSSILTEDSLEDVQEKHDLLLDQAERAVGMKPIFVTPLFHLQAMVWPQQPASETEALADKAAKLAVAASEYDEDDDFFEHWTDAIAEQCIIPHPDGVYRNPRLADEGILDRRDADLELRRTFRRLRADFRSMRHLPRAAPRRDHDLREYVPGHSSGLWDGLLENVFLVVDRYSAYTWWTMDHADCAWVWAIDPDFEDDGEEQAQGASASSNGLDGEYRGYMRVRLQQLVNNFFEARRFQPDVTLRMLWEAAKQSTRFAFVSLHPEDFQQHSSNFNVGTALLSRHATST